MPRVDVDADPRSAAVRPSPPAPGARIRAIPSMMLDATCEQRSTDLSRRQRRHHCEVSVLSSDRMLRAAGREMPRACGRCSGLVRLAGPKEGAGSDFVKR